MKAKQYQIKTVQDMVDCTNEDNLNNFLIDLRSLLITAHTFRNLSEIIGEMKGIPKEIQKIKSDGFIWIDDKKHNSTINLKIK